MHRAPFVQNPRHSTAVRTLLVGAAFAFSAASTFAQSTPAGLAAVPASQATPAPASPAPYGYSDDDFPAAKNSRKPSVAVSEGALPSPAASAAFDARAGAGSASNLSAIQFWNENDIFWSDRYYTNGLKLAYTTPEISTGKELPLFFRDLLKFSPLSENTDIVPAAYRLHFALAQEIYTPWREHTALPQPGDHPYSGLLYATVALSSETLSRLDSIELSVGILGPGSYARQAQGEWHRLIGVKLAEGWRHQLRDEPILQLGWTRAGRYTWLRKDSLQVDWHPRAHVEVGTIRDYASVGAQWRVGWAPAGLPRDFGIAGIRSSPAFTRPAGGFPDSAWLFVDLQGEGWLWNSTLDGNLWHKSAKVHRYPWVAEAVVGISAQWGDLRVSLSEVIRSKEFRGQHGEVSVHHILSLGLTF
ncbi:MAG: lipid A deacylase LpxR family protein [Puniceicoccales bacterium]|jgi:hypothetical protein|nr:lipid A deacylase LpxR family protein [Puniceicoccales bacterium]